MSILTGILKRSNMLLMREQISLKLSFLTTFLLCALALSLSAQQRPDSLMNLVQSVSGMEKYKALRALGKFYKMTDLPKSLDYAGQQRNLAIEMKNRKLEAEAMSDMAIPLTMMQQSKRAILLLQESISIFDLLGNEEGKAMATNNLGIVWAQFGSMEKSLACYLDVIPYYTKQGEMKNLAMVYMNLGLNYENLKKYDKALSAGLKAKEIFASIKNEQKINDVTVNIGITWQSMGRFNEAQACFEDALAYYKKNQNLYGMAVVTTNLAKMYKSKKDYQRASVWFEKALPLIRSIHNTWAEANLFLDRAVMQYGAGKFQDALTDLATASHLNAQVGDPDLQTQIAHTYYQVYDTLGQDRLALDYYKKYTHLNDSLRAQQKTKMIEELTIGFETVQKEAENQLLRKDVRAAKVRQWILIGFLSAILLTSILVITLLTLKRRNLLLKKQQAEQEKKLKEVEVKELESAKLLQDVQLKELESAKLLQEVQLKKIESEKLLQELQFAKMESEKKLQEDVHEMIRVELQLKEQDLVYQTLLRMDLTHINRSIQEKLLPFQFKFSGKKDQGDFMQVIQEITREAAKDPLADFEIMFTQMHESFNKNLLARCSSLTQTEFQVCAMLRINLSTKDIARMLNLSFSSIDMTRHRIRQKLELDPKESLTSFLITL